MSLLFPYPLMVIKSMARKSFSFGQLLEYIDAPAQVGPAILHNLPAAVDDLAAIRREFVANGHLLPPRKNGNLLYHEVLSFGSADRGALTSAVLEDLTRRYLELRAPYALAYARAHFDTDNPHVHIMISANNLGSSRRLRLDHRQFQEVKRAIQAYQRERYPQLQHSLVPERAERNRPKRARGEAERERRLCAGNQRQASRKELLRDLVRREIGVACSGAELFQRLKAQGYELYRRGQAIGIRHLESGRRYRLITLGVAAEFEQALQGWKRLLERQRLLRSLEQSQALARDQHRERAGP